MAWTVISVDEHRDAREQLANEFEGIEAKIEIAKSDELRARNGVHGAVQQNKGILTARDVVDAKARLERATEELASLTTEKEELPTRTELLHAVEAEDSLYNALLGRTFGCLITNEPVNCEKRNGSNTYFVMECLPYDPYKLLYVLDMLKVLDYLNEAPAESGELTPLGDEFTATRIWRPYKDHYCGLDKQHFGVSVTRIYSTGQETGSGACGANVVYLLCASVNYDDHGQVPVPVKHGPSSSAHSENWILEKTDETLIKLDGRLEAGLRSEPEETASSLRRKVGKTFVDRWNDLYEERQQIVTETMNENRRLKGRGMAEIPDRLPRVPDSDEDWELLKKSGAVGTSKKKANAKKNDCNLFSSTPNLVDAVDLFLIQDMEPCPERCQPNLDCFLYYYTVAGVKATVDWHGYSGSAIEP